MFGEDAGHIFGAFAGVRVNRAIRETLQKTGGDYQAASDAAMSMGRPDLADQLARQGIQNRMMQFREDEAAEAKRQFDETMRYRWDELGMREKMELAGLNAADPAAEPAEAASPLARNIIPCLMDLGMIPRGTTAEAAAGMVEHMTSAEVLDYQKLCSDERRARTAANPGVMQAILAQMQWNREDPAARRQPIQEWRDALQALSAGNVGEVVGKYADIVANLELTGLSPGDQMRRVREQACGRLATLDASHGDSLMSDFETDYYEGRQLLEKNGECGRHFAPSPEDTGADPDEEDEGDGDCSWFGRLFGICRPQQTVAPAGGGVGVGGAPPPTGGGGGGTTTLTPPEI